jgi:hypothetical protein
VTFDEGEGSTGDGPIGTILLSPRVKNITYASTNFYDHSSMLRTWQDIFGVGPYLAGAAYANDMNDMFKTVRISSITSDGASLHVTATNLIVGRPNLLLFSSTPTGPWQSVQTNTAIASGETLNLSHTNISGFYRLQELQ